jgi:iron(III) transport system permease protein
LTSEVFLPLRLHLVRQASPRKGWSLLFALLAVLFFVLPLLSLLVIAARSGTGVLPGWGILEGALYDTFWLMFGTGLIAVGLAVPLAWFVSRYDFPLRRMIEVVSILPLALPGYLAAYAYVSLLDHFGPVQGLLRALLGVDRLAWFPDLRSLPGACFVMGATLFPYVYLPARWSFERQSLRQIEAARNLGASARTLFWKIALPLARPAIVAGLMLALLETLNDIGATQYLGVQSLTVVTYTTWTIRDNLGGSAFIALVLLLIVTGLIFLERHQRRAKIYAAPSRHVALPDRINVHGMKGWLFCGLTLLPFLVGFAAPFCFMLWSSLRDIRLHGMRTEILDALMNTVLLAGGATVLIVALGFALVLARRLGNGMVQRSALALSMIGYGIPGLILVVGLLPLAGVVDQGLRAAGLISTAVLSGSLLLLIAVYALRFTAIASGQADAAMGRLSRNVDHAAATLGGSRKTLLTRILVPQLLPVAGAAGILVAVDCIKELPATLLLRPFNFETLSTLIYEAASRGAFEEGAFAALLIVLVGIVPMVLLFRLISRNA